MAKNNFIKKVFAISYALIFFTQFSLPSLSTLAATSSTTEETKTTTTSSTSSGTASEGLNKDYAAVSNEISYSVTGTPTVGNTIDIAVNMSYIANLYGASVDFLYDTSLIEVQSINQGSLFNNIVSTPTVQKVENGQANIAMTLNSSAVPISGSGSIAVIKAKVLKSGTINLKTTDTINSLSLTGFTACVKLSDNLGSKIGYTFVDDNITTTETPTPTPIPTIIRIEENTPNLNYSGTWGIASGSSNSGNTNKYSKDPNSSLSFSFTGTELNVIGFKGKAVGTATITIDGTSYSWDGYSATDMFKQVLFKKTDLASGTHNVTIQVTGQKNNSASDSYVNLDAFDIIGGTIVTPSLIGTRIDENNSYLSYSGTWGISSGSSNSGYTNKYSKDPNSSLSFSFTGTELNVIGFKGKAVGTATINIDGTSYTWDGYSSTDNYQQVLFKKTGLSNVTHAVTIKVTGQKNSSASDSYVNLDAFDIVGGTIVAPTSTATRIDENNSNLSYSGTWGISSGSSNSGYTNKYSKDPNSSLSFSFTGTELNVIGFKGKAVGTATINIDGTSYTWDGYSSTDNYQQVLFKKTGLSNATHAVTIKVTGQKNSSASDSYVNLDAFDIVGGTVVAPTSTATRIDENNSNLSYSGTWGMSSGLSNSGNTNKYSKDPNSSLSFSFTGTGLRVVGFKGKLVGTATINIDGTSYTWDGYSSTDNYQQVLFEKTGLSSGTHAVTIKVTGQKNSSASDSYVNLDAFDIVGGTVVAPTSTATRIDENNSNLSYSGTWGMSSGLSNSGNTNKYSKDPNSSLSFSFTGTGLKVVGFKGKLVGTATINIDGTSYTWDGYSSTDNYQQVLFEKTGLSSGTHAVTIKVTGQKNSSASDSYVNLDAFDILDGNIVDGNIVNPDSVVTRIEENSAELSYSGTWGNSTGSSNSGNTNKYSKDPNSSLSFSFTGTGLKVIGFKGKLVGTATITIDGILYNWDAYSAVDSFQQVLFQKTNLSRGTHSVTIQVTGQKNSSASDSYVNLDAFDIVS